MATYSFDRTFDRTFRGGTVIPAPVGKGDLQSCGFTVMYMTPKGWCFWTFEAYTDTKLSAKSLGSYNKNRLTIDILKIATVSYVIRTSFLSRSEAERVSMIVASSAVYWLRQNASNELVTVPVRVESSDVNVWSELEKDNSIEMTVSLAYTTSYRR